MFLHFRILIHINKRKYLRQSLNELSLLFTDSPCLLGPKILHLLIALSMARDEVNWLLRHQHSNLNEPNLISFDDLSDLQKDWIDEQLAELLLLIEELRSFSFFSFFFTIFFCK